MFLSLSSLVGILFEYLPSIVLSSLVPSAISFILEVCGVVGGDSLCVTERFVVEEILADKADGEEFTTWGRHCFLPSR